MSNTLRVALAGVVLASVLGVAVGLLRLSHHPLVSGLSAAYVEIFRNIPLLIQLLAIYLLITELLPGSTDAWSVDGVALLSKEGLQIAVPEPGKLALLCALVAFAAGAIWACMRGAAGSRSAPESLRSRAALWRRSAHG